MKYYVYLDSDDNAVVRSGETIDNHDPGFWGRNSHLVSTVWEVESTDLNSIISLLETFERKRMVPRVVREVCQSIGFDLDGYIASRKSAVKK